MSIIELLVERLICLTLIVEGLRLWDGSHPWYLHVFAIVAFIVGIEYLCHTAERQERRRLMPYRWDCPICEHKEGAQPTGTTASHPAFVEAFRDEHNRTVHLMEP